MQEAPGERGGVELQVVDRLHRLVSFRVSLVDFRDEALLPVSLPDGVQPGFFVPGHALEDAVVFLGHLLNLVGTEDIAKLDVAVFGVKVLLLGSQKLPHFDLGHSQNLKYRNRSCTVHISRLSIFLFALTRRGTE